MNAEVFITTLKAGFNGTLKDKKLKRSEVVLQEDNDPKHTSALAKKYMIKARINVLDWPSYSPDLSLIENLWSLLKYRLYNGPNRPTDKKSLIAGIKREWEKITDEYIRGLYRGMP
ncbi:hypothetical protein PAPHI01_2086 [Pancytospora philotis]|nr:hypothetical protein PAPHI01_2086 [Pancytospora philotis]